LLQLEEILGACSQYPSGHFGGTKRLAGCGVSKFNGHASKPIG
jgi:hypothetical protein